MLVNNSAGESGFRQLYLNGQLAYRLKLDKHLIASGIQVGFVNKSFDPSKMTFDDQYQPDQGFNPSNPTTETFSYSSLTRPSFGAGIMWAYGDPRDERLLPFAGISVQHLNQPKESFIEQNNFIPRRYTAQAGVGIHVSEHLIVTPSILWAQQQFANELMASTIVKMPLQERSHVEGGLIYRNKDAVAAYAGYQWNSFMLGVSYDVNISGIGQNASAFELSLTYIPKAKVKKEEKKKQKSPKPAKETAKEEKETRKPPVSAPATPKSQPVTAAPAVKPSTVAPKPVTVNPTPARKPTSAATPSSTTSPAQKTGPAISTPVPVSQTTSTQTETRQADSIKAVAAKPVTTVPVTAEIKEAPKRVTDSDQDGVPDSLDQCPYMKGGAGTKGCPDTDGDGIIDTKDKCPMEKGDATNNGCAPAKATAAKAPSSTHHFGNIEFRTGSNEVHGLYKLDIIEPALDSLFMDERYRLVITGHTDSEGDAPFNMVLSQSRADKVKAILLKKGLDEGRITTVAYGENMPLLDNRSEEGRQHNRRVELHIIKEEKK
jgi:type IX secretion system PorP/SprF family membrane protein